jgi:hypothetical protein
LNDWNVLNVWNDWNHSDFLSWNDWNLHPTKDGGHRRMHEVRAQTDLHP